MTATTTDSARRDRVDPPAVGGGDGSAALSWPGMTAGVGAVVAGGAYAVDTDALTGFAAALTAAAECLDDARTHALRAQTQARDAVAPTGRRTGPLSDAAAGSRPVPLIDFPSLPSSSLPEGGPLGTPGACSTPGFEALRARAVDAAAALTTGTGSLQDAADGLRGLAADVTACVNVYTGAEDDVVLGVGDAGAAGWTVMGLLAATGATLSLLPLVGYLVGAGVTNPDLTSHAGGDLADGLDDLAVVMSDADLSEWVKKDLLTLAILVDYARRASTGREAAAVETYLAGVVQRLDPEISKKLPERVLSGGGRMEPTSSLTSMERVVYYMSGLSAQVAAKRYGEPTGTVVAAHGGPAVTIPPSSRDPMALGTGVPLLGLSGTRVNRPLGAASDVIRYSDSLKKRDEDTSSGVVGVLRTTHADGGRSWVVVVPGTTDWGLGGSNPQDLLTNLQAVAGAPNDMESAVVTAMRQAGIGPDEPVGLYGHSQGAIVATNIAANPAIAERYNVTNLLTAGGPTAGADLPENVNALHLENGADAVPALDGAPTPRTPTRTVVTVDTTGSNLEGYPHASTVYADAVEGMSGDPAVDAWTEQLRSLTGAGEEGATTSEIVFDITRKTTGVPARPDDSDLADALRALKEQEAEAWRDGRPWRD